MRRFRLGQLLCVALLSLLTSCDKPVRDLGATDFSPRATLALPLELFPSLPPSSADAMPVLRQLEIPASRTESNWTVDSAVFEFAPKGSRRPGETGSLLEMIHRRGSSIGPKRVEIPGPFDSADFEGVRVDFTFFKKDALRVGFVNGDETPVFSEFQGSGERGEKTNYSFRLTDFLKEEFGDQNSPPVYERLVLETKGPTADALLSDLALLGNPDTELGSQKEPARLAHPVSLGPEYRNAVAVDTGETLESELVLPPGARLSFSRGAQFATPKGGKGTLTLRIRGSGEEWDQKFKLSQGQDWEHQSFDLSSFEDARALFQFEFQSSNAEGTAFVGSPTVYVPRANPPTVLLVTSDTHRSDSLGLTAPEGALETPHLDALAQAGTLFEDALSTANVTNPSHIALMTGVHPRDTGIVDHTTQLAESALTLADVFRSKGYATFASVSVSHLSHRTSGLGQGFDRMSTPTSLEQRAAQALKPLEDWLPEAEDRPLFVWLHVFDAHGPYQPPGKYDRMYWDGGDPYDESLPEMQFEGFAPPELKFSRAWNGLRELEFPVAQYRGEISYLDDQLGRVLAWPRMRHALIAVTSDHGESHGEHGVYFNHAMLFPANLRVPLILKGPGVPAGTRTAAPVQNHDLGRTLLDLAQLDDVEFPGSNLLNAEEQDSSGPRYSLSAHGFEGGISEDGWHLWLQLKKLPNGQSPDQGVMALYPLQGDVHEQRSPEANRVNDPEHAERVAAMRTKLIDWLVATAPTHWGRVVKVTEEEIEGLRTLGYTHYEGPVRRFPVWWEEPGER